MRRDKEKPEGRGEAAHSDLPKERHSGGRAREGGPRRGVRTITIHQIYQTFFLKNKGRVRWGDGKWVCLAPNEVLSNRKR